jgi:putative tricarboxylic transport membrane protein
MLLHRVRRVAVGLSLCAVAATGASACSSANDAGSAATSDGYPTGRVSIMAPADPGGGWDETARALQDTVRETRLAKGADVYNVPGAGGTIGLNQLATKRSGDPNQLMVMGLVMVGAIEQNKARTNLSKVTPIASLTTEPEAIVVPAKSKYQTLQQLVDDLKADPATVSFAGGSAGGSDHLLVGLLAKAAGVPGSKVKYVAYAGGGEAKAAILSGSVDAGVSGVSEFADQVKVGKMRVLAVSSAKPVPVGGKPAPTIKDAGYDVEMTNWRGLVAPPGISAAEREQIVAWVEKLHASSAWRENLQRFGWTDFFQVGSQFDQFVQSETTRVKPIVRDLGLTS